MKKFLLVLTITVFIVSIQSCLSPSKLYYFHDQAEGKQSLDSIGQDRSLKIHPGDRIQVTVSSPDPTITTYLNPFGNITSGSPETQAINGFLVSNEGTIQFPQIGFIKLAGLSTTDAAKVINDSLSYYYKDLFVSVNLTGRVFFMSGRNGTPVIMRNERLTIFEAMSQAGVQDPYDKKNAVWLVREEGGERNFAKLNLNSKEIFVSPYYYLHNNDLIYMQPSRLSSFLSPNSPARSILTISGALLTLFLVLKSQ